MKLVEYTRNALYACANALGKQQKIEGHVAYFQMYVFCYSLLVLGTEFDYGTYHNSHYWPFRQLTAQCCLLFAEYRVDFVWTNADGEDIVQFTVRPRSKIQFRVCHPESILDSDMLGLYRTSSLQIGSVVMVRFLFES